MSYTLSTTVDQPFDDTVTAVRSALSEQGFGVLTEIDLSATLEEKLGARIAAQVILGACMPPLALAAIEAEPSIGVLLPCNVVVRSVDGQDGTVVEAMDPSIMVTMTGNDALREVAADAHARLTGALAALGGSAPA
ncbi:MAG: DUF302 domain-containing protein [Ornithinibacter sp.]